MSGRAPYGPPLDRVAECVCEVYLMDTPLSIHEAAQTCGQYQGYAIDSRTLARYVARDLTELNRRTSQKCGKKVQRKCVKEGIEIVQSLDGALRERRNPLLRRLSHEETLDGEDGDLCLADPESEVKPKDIVRLGFKVLSGIKEQTESELCQAEVDEKPKAPLIPRDLLSKSFDLKFDPKDMPSRHSFLGRRTKSVFNIVLS